MCLLLFVASDAPIEMSAGWNGTTALSFHPLADADAWVRNVLSKPHVVYAGSHTGCSCGFAFGLIEPHTEAEQAEEARGRQSVAALRDFLAIRLAHEREVQLLACWAGNEGSLPGPQRTVGLDYFEGEDFQFPERAVIVVRHA
jgi:hypothetical protein